MYKRQGQDIVKIAKALGGGGSAQATILGDGTKVGLGNAVLASGTLADLLAGRFRDRGWSVSRDDAGNLRADIPASPGREEAPLVALQGHLDMVCAAAPGSGWDPLTDPVAARVEDGVLRTDGRSSLGADNNLGNAAVFYLLGFGTVLAITPSAN